MEEFWGDDPAEDPFFGKKGKALRSARNISADKIIDSITMDDLGKPGELGISRNDWLTKSSKILSESKLGARKFYHGSYDKLEVGEILTPGEDDYEENWGHNEWYQALHKHKPMESRQHSWSVFMVADEDDIDLAGGADDYVYVVEPVGDVERHDLNWASEISYLLDQGHDINSNEVKEAAINYWTGQPHTNESVWEYLAPKAKIVSVLSEGVNPSSPAGALFLKSGAVIVGQDHGKPPILSSETLKKVQDVAAKHGAWYEGDGKDAKEFKEIAYTGGSFDDEIAKEKANPNDYIWVYVLFSNVKENDRLQQIGINPDDTIFNRLLASAKAISYQGIGFTSQALTKFLSMASEGEYDFVKMSQLPATQKNLKYFLESGEALMWPATGWENYPHNAGKIAKAATVDTRDRWLANAKPGVYVVGSGHLVAIQQLSGAELTEGDMKADREAGIKWVDDPDWKRLHDMDDKIIQDYIDHKKPKKELNDDMQFILPDPKIRRKKEKQDKEYFALKGIEEQSTLFEAGTGDCFAVAGKTMIEMGEEQGVKLVHAYVYGQGELEGRRFPHAWNEMGDVALDYSNGNKIVMRKEQYYPAGGVTNDAGAYVTYNSEDSMINMLKHGHWGPWDLNDVLDEEIPDETNEIGKQNIRISKDDLNLINVKRKYSKFKTSRHV